MEYLFTIVTYPLKQIISGISQLIIDNGVSLGSLIYAGIFVTILIGIVTHISISAGHIKRFGDKKE